MQKLHKYIVTNTFYGYLPRIEDYELVEETIPTLKKGEFLVKTAYLSVDPYMRSFANNFKVPYDQFGFQVGRVIESINSEYPLDTFVVSHSGWKDFVILNSDRDNMFGIKPYEPDIGEFPLSFSLGVLGMPGMTAYLGFLNICAPQNGDIVCVSSAAGAVGSLVGQIAKLKECIVIGFAGTDEKVHMLISELGFDHAFNYKTENINQILELVAPNGIDCYFDNVGGELSANIIKHVKDHGRVAICGSISTYGSQKCIFPNFYRGSVKIEHFNFTQWDWAEQQNALAELKIWLQKGDIIAKETIYDGFEEAPTALISMLSGNNMGKAVIKI